MAWALELIGGDRGKGLLSDLSFELMGKHLDEDVHCFLLLWVSWKYCGMERRTWITRIRLDSQLNPNDMSN